jgi:hypothetical protein
MMKIEGSGSAYGSISQRHGSADPDPHQNVVDPQHWLACRYRTPVRQLSSCFMSSVWSLSRSPSSGLPLWTCRPPTTAYRPTAWKRNPRRGTGRRPAAAATRGRPAWRRVWSWAASSRAASTPSSHSRQNGTPVITSAATLSGRRKNRLYIEPKNETYKLSVIVSVFKTTDGRTAIASS